MNKERIERALRSRYWEFIVRNGPVREVAPFLESQFPEYSVEEWQVLFRHGGIYLNGEPVSGNISPFLPYRLEFYEPKEDVKGWLAKRKHTLPENSIAYEDQNVIVLAKPPKFPTLPAREQRCFSLHQQIERYLGVRPHMPSRLDFSTSGLVVASKTPSFHNTLQSAFEARTVRKGYLLGVEKTPEWDEKTVQTPIGFHPEHALLRAPNGRSSKEAETHFIKVSNAKEGERCWLLALPKTGRTHQIRVHSRALGCPIVGDNFYDGPSSNDLHLLSAFLVLPSTVLPEERCITIPLKTLPSFVPEEIYRHAHMIFTSVR